MQRRTRLALSLATAAVLSVAVSLRAGSAEDKYVLTELKEAAPDALAAEIRGALGKTGFRVADASGKAVSEIWFRGELPVLEKFQERDDTKYPIEPGTFVGAIRFPAASSDYRKQTIKAGVYTLRYGHQPQDGNHLGTADYRDFLTIAPAAEDKSPAKLTQDQAMELSKKASGTTHPSILSLLPPQKKGREKLPMLAHDAEHKFELLVVKVAGKAGDKTRKLQIELVAIGHAAE